MGDVMRKSRDFYFDFLRGVAIVMVVAIHCYPNHIRLSDGYMEVVMILVRNIMNCAVPIFLAISGYFIAKRVGDFPDFSWRQYWLRQIPKIYIPCLIFSIPWFLLSVYGGSSVFKQLIMTILCGMSVYYFILLIISCYIVSPLVMKIKSKWLFGIAVILSLVSVVGWFCYNSLRGGQLPLIVQGSIISFGVYFVIGIIIGRDELKYSIKWPFVIMIFGLVLSLVETYFWQTQHNISAVGQKGSAIIFNIGILFLLFCPDVRSRYRDTKFQKFIRWIGDISFGIYFTHVLLIFMFRKYWGNIMESWVVSTLAVLGMTAFIVTICKRFAPGFSKKYLGYR